MEAESEAKTAAITAANTAGKTPAKAAVSKPNSFRVPIMIAIVMGLILFLPAGSFRFWPAWIYWFISVAMRTFFGSYFLKRNPELLARRNQFQEKEPQKAISTVLSLAAMAGFLIPGFDQRFDWSAVPVWLVVVSNAVVFFGWLLIFVVFKENSFASTVIQVEAGQQVINTGPYAIVRHPMYTGLLLTLLFTPLALGSFWALLCFLLFIPVLISRIKDEERKLLRDLPGYQKFCAQTPYRLIPFIW